VTNGIPTRVGM